MNWRVGSVYELSSNTVTWLIHIKSWNPVANCFITNWSKVKGSANKDNHTNIPQSEYWLNSLLDRYKIVELENANKMVTTKEDCL